MELWILFITGFVAALTPGPDMLLLARITYAISKEKALQTLIGILCGNLIFLLIIYVGLYTLINTSLSLILLNAFGGMYLFYLAYMIARSRSESIELKTDLLQSGFLSGLLINLTNPKAMLFFLVILTPFLKEEGLILQMGALFGGIMAAFLSLITGVAYFKSKEISRRFSGIADTVMAIIFFLFAVGMFLRMLEMLNHRL